MYHISLSREGKFRIHGPDGMRVDIGDHFAATPTGNRHVETRLDIDPAKPVTVRYYELRVPEEFARCFNTPRVLNYTTSSHVIAHYLDDVLEDGHLHILSACQVQNRLYTWYVPTVDGIEFGLYGARR